MLNAGNYVIGFLLLTISCVEISRNDAVVAENSARAALQHFENTAPNTFLVGVARCLVGLSLEGQGQAEEGAAMVLSSHDLMATGSIPDPYPELCRLPDR